jgi:GH24 family phage-related lysozyme (muramidase)
VAEPRVSAKLVEFVSKFESFQPNPYWDISRWSHGFGTYASGPDDTVTEAEALAELKVELKRIVPYIPRKKRLKQQEIDALASFGYNNGPAALMDEDYSTFARRMASEEGKQFETRKQIYKDELPRWRMPGSKYEQGLLRRRKAEIEMAIHGDYRINE